LIAPVLPPATRFESDGAAMECSIVPWDSEVFGFTVAQVTSLGFTEGAQASGMLRQLEAWCADHDVRLVSCRLDHTQLRESMALEEVGFRFVEMVYEPHFDLVDGMAAPARGILVEDAPQDDLASIEEIAYSAFTTGRFLLDWRLPPELSKRRYATWVRNSLAAPEQTLLKAELDGDLVGFFIVERRADGSVYWHLTAIAPGWQGKGIGMSVWQTMLIRHRAEGATAVDTTISGHNAPVINLYARLGFTFGLAKMTFHWLRDQDPNRPKDRP
jgi:ribosomal protein S18 acetylase RimI-like enzyme